MVKLLVTLEPIVGGDNENNQTRFLVLLSLLVLLQLIIFAIAYTINVDLQMLASIKKLRKHANIFFLVIQKFIFNGYLKINYRHPELFEKHTLYWSVMLSNVLDYFLFLQIGLLSATFISGYKNLPDWVFAVYIIFVLPGYIYRLIKFRRLVRQAEKEYEESQLTDYEDV